MNPENRIEKEIGSIELTSKEGKVFWFKKFTDGTVSSPEQTGLSTADSVGIKVLIETLEDDYGKGVVRKLP